MRVKTKLAGLVRAVGGESIVENPKLRKALGAPMYKRHRQQGGGTAAKATQGGAGAKQATPAANPTQKPKIVRDESLPLLSVIVPCYNVADYLDSCMESIVEQTYTNLQIILVNDGSTDNTRAKVEEWVQRDERVESVHQQNGGLSAARNAGVARAKGEFITFVDSDDQVFANAYEIQVGSLLENNADVAIGGIERFNSTRVWVPSWVEDVHGEEHLGVTGQEYPPICWDVFAWNKVYRTATWLRVVKEFPVGKLYEDQEGTARLYLDDSVKLNVLADITYRWRSREDGTSITQDKLSLDNLNQRLDVARDLEVILQGASDEYRQYWYRKMFNDDLYWYIRTLPRADEEYWEILHTFAAERYQHVDPVAASFEYGVDRRILAYLLANGTFEDVCTALIYFDRRGIAPQVIQVDGQWVGTFPILDELRTEVPVEVRLMPEGEFTTVSAIESALWSDSGLELSGYAYLEGLFPAADRDVNVVIYDDAGEVVLEKEAEKRESTEANISTRVAFVDVAQSGFRVTFSREELLAACPAVSFGSTSKYSIAIRVRNGEYEYEVAPNTPGPQFGAVSATHAFYAGNARLRLKYTADEGLQLLSARPIFVLRSLSADSLEIRGEFAVNETADGPLAWRIKRSRPRLTVEDDKGEKVLDVDVTPTDSGTWRFVLTVKDVPKTHKANWLDYPMMVEVPRVVKAPLACPETIELSETGETLLATTDEPGNLVLTQRAQSVRVDALDYDVESDCLVASGVAFFDESQVRTSTPTFALVGKNHVIRASEVTYRRGTGRFTAKWEVTDGTGDGLYRVIPTDRYVLQVLTASGKALPGSIWGKATHKLADQLPKKINEPLRRFEFTLTPRGNGIHVSVLSPIGNNASGKYYQWKMAQIFQDSSRVIDPEAVLFECYGGKGISDSPLAIDRELAARFPGWKRYWTVIDGNAEVPEGAIPVVLYSAEWFRALATSKYLVNNNNFPFFFRKHPEQVYLQTWHGTPLKRIGNDVPALNLTLSYRELMRKEAEEEWDYLIAQSPWASQQLASSFGYSGEVLNLGYPRNDPFVRGADDEAVRNRIRRNLGVDSSKTVVLYAPTWRDNLKKANGTYAAVNFVDYASFAKSLGSDFVVLVRGHSNSFADKAAAHIPGVIDVTQYPDINDLMLAADILVTDYSSLMFDFAISRRPMLFHAPDLEEYENRVRGFYLEYEETVPGPITTTQAQLVEAVKGATKNHVKFLPRIEAFTEKFAPNDDGNAARRVVERVFKAS